MKLIRWREKKWRIFRAKNQKELRKVAKWKGVKGNIEWQSQRKMMKKEEMWNDNYEWSDRNVRIGGSVEHSKNMICKCAD